MSAPVPVSPSVLCAIPGLIWPGNGLAEILSPLALPGLSALLAHAEAADAPPCSLDVWLAAQFGLHDDLPFAAIRLAGEQAAAPDRKTLWVCADPVSLRFARQHLLLDAPETLALHADEMTSLLGDLNQTFMDVGKFSCTSPEHCYLALNPEHGDKLPVALAPLADVESRPIAQFQARGAQAAWWSKLANDLQVFCHNHSVNTAREVRRAPALNALWLWGVGHGPAQLLSPSPDIAARLQHPNGILNGLARYAQADVRPFDIQHPAAWSLLDALHAPAQQRDAASWARALEALDAEILLPLSRHLQAGSIAQLRIVAPGDTSLSSFDISPAPRWKFWQRGANKAQLVAALGKPSA